MEYPSERTYDTTLNTHYFQVLLFKNTFYSLILPYDISQVNVHFTAKCSHFVIGQQKKGSVILHFLLIDFAYFYRHKCNQSL